MGDKIDDFHGDVLKNTNNQIKMRKLDQPDTLLLNRHAVVIGLNFPLGSSFMAVKLYSGRRFADARGWFSETYNARAFAGRGIDASFVQDNMSLSRPKGTIRGLHFQTPPHAQAKLVRCLRGAIFDVAVDVRLGSPTYGQWVGAELSAENDLQLFIPVGFAHGFMTLQPDTEVFYKVTDFYAPTCDGGLLWSDPDIGVEWPALPDARPLLSEKDEKLPRFAQFKSPFPYDGVPLSLIKV